MAMKTSRRTVLTLCTALAATPGWAATTDVLIGLDSKIVWNDRGQTNVEPGEDLVLVMDTSNPARPRIRASIKLTNSVAGPPTNLQVTPDGRLGLVANSVLSVKEGAKDNETWKLVPDDKLYVLNLEASPPALTDTLVVGKQPSGLAITKAGDLALVANRAGKSVSVLSISGTTVKAIAEIPIGQEAAGIAIAPDGKRAFAVLNLVNKVAVLSIDGQAVAYDKTLDVPAAFNPYNIEPIPNTPYVVASSTGAGGNNADALTTIDTRGPHPRVVALVAPGTGAEGLAFSPNGKWAVTPLLLGTALKPSEWAYTRTGEAALLSVTPSGTLTPVNRVKVGALPEGVVFSATGDYVYVGNYTDKTVQVLRVAGGKLVDTGVVVKLPGQPASMRGVPR